MPKPLYNKQKNYFSSLEKMEKELSKSQQILENMPRKEIKVK